MSILYRLFIESIGHFSIGRFADLLQQDLIVVLLSVLVIYKIKWWIKMKDR